MVNHTLHKPTGTYTFHKDTAILSIIALDTANRSFLELTVQAQPTPFNYLSEDLHLLSFTFQYNFPTDYTFEITPEHFDLFYHP